MENEKNNPEQPAEPTNETTEPTRADRTEMLMHVEEHGKLLIAGLGMYLLELAMVGILVPQLAELGLMLEATNNAVSKIADGTLNDVANDLAGTPTVPLAPPTDLSNMN